MFKFVLTYCWVMALLLGNIQAASSEDMEDRFLEPDLVSAKNIFIDVKNVSLVNVLKIISKQSNLSFIADQNVADKKITVYLNRVPLDQALQTVLDANGLAYDMQDGSNVFVVKEKEKTAKNLITKVYQLKYASVSTSKINSTITISNPSISSASSGSSSGSSSSSLAQRVLRVQEALLRVFQPAAWKMCSRIPCRLMARWWKTRAPTA